MRRRIGWGVSTLVTTVAMAIFLVAPAHAQYVTTPPGGGPPADPGVPVQVLAGNINAPQDPAAAVSAALALTGADVVQILLLAIAAVGLGTVMVRRARPAVDKS